MDLTTPLTNVKGIGPARAGLLAAKGLTTVEERRRSTRTWHARSSRTRPPGIAPAHGLILLTEAC